MMRPPKFLLRLFSRLHARIYARTDGQRRSHMNGLPVLLLTTRGRVTGRAHTVPIVYLEDVDGYLVAPGIVPRPDWYLNLQKNPRAEIQVGAWTTAVHAEEIGGLERARRWASVPEYWRDYERRAGITLPLVKLRQIGP